MKKNDQSTSSNTPPVKANPAMNGASTSKLSAKKSGTKSHLNSNRDKHDKQAHSDNSDVTGADSKLPEKLSEQSVPQFTSKTDAIDRKKEESRVAQITNDVAAKVVEAGRSVGRNSILAAGACLLGGFALSRFFKASQPSSGMPLASDRQPTLPQTYPRKSALPATVPNDGVSDQAGAEFVTSASVNTPGAFGDAEKIDK